MTVTRKHIVLLLLVAIVAAAATFFFMRTPSAPPTTSAKPKTATLSAEELALLQDGDFIFRQGFGTFSELVGKTFGKEYGISHSGIVCKPDSAHIYIIHALSSTCSNIDGVQRCNLKRFLAESKPNTIIISRFRSTHNADISKRARTYLRQQTPFDHTFNFSDSTSLCCTELLWQILKDEFATNIFEKEDNYISFTPFINSKYVDVILDQHHALKE